LPGNLPRSANHVNLMKTIPMKQFVLDGKPSIQLNQLLKLLGMVETGGEANMEITSGNVKVNGNTEFQKRKKLFPGYRIEYNGETIEISGK